MCCVVTVQSVLQFYFGWLQAICHTDLLYITYRHDLACGLSKLLTGHSGITDLDTDFMHYSFLTNPSYIQTSLHLWLFFHCAPV